jgi:hypothetical protein
MALASLNAPNFDCFLGVATTLNLIGRQRPSLYNAALGWQLWRLPGRIASAHGTSEQRCPAEGEKLYMCSAKMTLISYFLFFKILTYSLA